MAKEIAKKFFLDYFPQYRSQIRAFKKILVGFSNQIFKATLLDGRSYKVRVAENNNLISREGEIEVLKWVEDPNLIYYEESTGNAIYNWIEGDQLSVRFINEEMLQKIIELAEKYHKVPVDQLQNVPTHDHFDAASKVDKDRIEYRHYFPIYRELVEKYRDLPLVLTHNDISLKNLIYDPDSGSDELILIDYEWARLNTIYWEYGNFIRESLLSKEKIVLLSKLLKLEENILIDFAFISTYYSWQLSFNWDRSERLEKYRCKLIAQLEKYEGWRHKTSLME
ncbi:phosphotransferase [Candidatus Mycoplasma haematominutum]|uniref:Choline kinase n=1 Tax=Candidatus Mycoplasma haematominutum 'Birmingham 1' TaxID=1116213 RepID=G8C382_9MOLU|nr:phosphotransferase [Candidatus Mycoplasma haematominutum]CCE66780.1 choline kinase [Candidatus Mycoplasma haematominutum 'Birmingham 1']